MSSNPTVRQLPPQSSQMSTFSFAQPTYQPQQRETQKNFVFVDEHSRSKRLKVVRACEGCRRRKIKCDAATTNIWPCTACIRLKLQCVRPNGFDGAAEPCVFEPQCAQFEPSQIQDDFQQQVAMPVMHPQHLVVAPKPINMYSPHPMYPDSSPIYSSVYDQHAMTQSMHYAAIPSSTNLLEHSFPTPNSFGTPPQQHMSRAESSTDTFKQEQYDQVVDLLGSLKVNEVGSAPYLNNKMRQKMGSGEEEPAVEDADDYKSVLPPLLAGPGVKIRIPPELMPDEQTMLHYFDLYFTHAHPYVPVLDKTHFYEQWHTNRESLSPLLLESMLAIAGRLADDPTQGQQWLALATRHADSFMDVPRLSTLQALLVILKAREQAPKKGYYYRSWMSIVQCVQMAKDLGLDEHYFDHQIGRPCGGTLSECLLKHRIWQTIFVCELMIGSPQSRTDLQVDIDSVNFHVPQPNPNADESEYHVSRNFTYMARIVRNIARMNLVYARLKKKHQDWALDPQFLQIRTGIDAWLVELPSDLTITLPSDGSPPWVTSPFIGNLHTYHYLSIILFHRPQIALFTQDGADGQWRHHMMVSYSAAKTLCRLQEAVLRSFGLIGLQSMQRGINFTIYAVLTCVVLHLVILTHPDPELSSDAREYFERHMRILETCILAWPMPDMQRQIDSVREAFSADTRKPFVLKASFPYGSPQSATQSTPPLLVAYRSNDNMARAESMDHLDTRSSNHQIHYSHPITPPISAGPADVKDGSPDLQSLTMISSGDATRGTGMVILPTTEPPAWNPSRILDQWNTSFGTPIVQQPASSLAPSNNTLRIASLSPGTAGIRTVQDIQAVHAQLPAGSATISYTAAPLPASTFVTPAMWRESVASVYAGGLKRAWDGA